MFLFFLVFFRLLSLSTRCVSNIILVLLEALRMWFSLKQVITPEIIANCGWYMVHWNKCTRFTITVSFCAENHYYFSCLSKKPREQFIDVRLHGKIFVWAQIGNYSFKEFKYKVFLNLFTSIFWLRTTFVISLPFFERQSCRWWRGIWNS